MKFFLCVVSFITFLDSKYFIKAETCIPYAIRVALGYHYTETNDMNDILEISFNTNDTCSNSLLLIKLSNSFNFRTILPQSNYNLDMGQIYKDDPKIQYTYSTFIHRFQVDNVYLGRDYTYMVQGEQGQTMGPFTIKIPTKIQEQNEVKKIIFMGDMDSRWEKNMSNYTFDWLLNEQRYNRRDYDLVLFNGDLAYDLESQDCQRGDYFIRNLSLFASQWPLLIAPGNHDSGNNSKFDFFKNTFFSPEQSQFNTPEQYLNFQSFDLGYAHFIGYNPYLMVYKLANKQQIQTIIDALRQDLIKANQNRQNVPWIIIFNHYPIYCSGYQDKQCYENFQTFSALADLFQEFHVDMYIGAHQHNYERDAPTYNNKTTSYKHREGDINQNYIEDSSTPVYIVEGVAGNDYYMPSEIYPSSQYTVNQTVNVGVGVLSILNKTHLLFEQREAKNNNKADFFYLIKNPDPSNKRFNPKILGIALGISFGMILLSVCCYAIHRYKNQKRDLHHIEQLSQESDIQEA